MDDILFSGFGQGASLALGLASRLRTVVRISRLASKSVVSVLASESLMSVLAVSSALVAIYVSRMTRSEGKKERTQGATRVGETPPTL